MYTCRAGEPQMVEADVGDHSVIIASEALTAEGSWEMVPDGSFVIVDGTGGVTIRPHEIQA